MHTSPIPGAPLHPSQSPYGTSPSASSQISPSSNQPGSVPFNNNNSNNDNSNNNNNNNVGEPPTKVVPDISFDDLSASFRSLYRSMFDASVSNQSFGGKSYLS
jgi:hypothetical protein